MVGSDRRGYRSEECVKLGGVTQLGQPPPYGGGWPDHVLSDRLEAAVVHCRRAKIPWVQPHSRRITVVSNPAASEWRTSSECSVVPRSWRTCAGVEVSSRRDREEQHQDLNASQMMLGGVDQPTRIVMSRRAASFSPRRTARGRSRPQLNLARDGLRSQQRRASACSDPDVGVERRADVAAAAARLCGGRDGSDAVLELVEPVLAR